jgi:hypothetical protein
MDNDRLQENWAYCEPPDDGSGKWYFDYIVTENAEPTLTALKERPLTLRPLKVWCLPQKKNRTDFTLCTEKTASSDVSTLAKEASPDKEEATVRATVTVISFSFLIIALTLVFVVIKYVYQCGRSPPLLESQVKASIGSDGF